MSNSPYPPAFSGQLIKGVDWNTLVNLVEGNQLKSGSFTLTGNVSVLSGSNIIIQSGSISPFAVTLKADVSGSPTDTLGGFVDGAVVFNDVDGAFYVRSSGSWLPTPPFTTNIARSVSELRALLGSGSAGNNGSLSNVRIYIPPGLYQLGTLPLDIGVNGQGVQNYPYVEIRGAGPQRTILQYTGSGNGAVRIYSNWFDSILADIGIDCVSTGNNSNGIEFHGGMSSNSRLENLIVSNANVGINYIADIGGTEANAIFRYVLTSNCIYGIILGQAGSNPMHRWRIEDSYFSGTGQTDIGNGITVGAGTCFGGVISNSTVANTHNGIVFTGSSGGFISIFGTYIQLPSTTGFHLISGPPITCKMEAFGLNTKGATGVLTSGSGQISFLSGFDGTGGKYFQGRVTRNYSGSELAPGGGATTKSVTFTGGGGFPEPDANYSVILTPLSDPVTSGSIYVTNKATSGFTLNYSVAGGNDCNWIVVR